jgi:hypothetical protein
MLSGMDGTTGSSGISTPVPRRDETLVDSIRERSPLAELIRWIRATDILALRQKLGLSLLIIAIAGGVYWFINDGRRADLDYFVPLANAFLHGRLGLVDAPSYLNELVPSGTGQYFVVYPPAPAIVALPFVLVFGPSVDQAQISIALGAVNVALAWWVLQGMGLTWRRALGFTAVFAFGTIVWYSAQAGSSWQFAHVVAIAATLLALRLAQLDAPPWAIGLCFGVALLSRLPTALAGVFFAAYLVDRAVRARDGAVGPFGALGIEAARISVIGLPWPAITRLAVSFVVGAGIPLALYGAYNVARFGSPTEAGYGLIPGLLQEAQYQNGFFSLVNVPRILYAMFLTTPVQVPGFPWVQPRLLGGLSILLTTPAFLWAIAARRADWFTLGAWASAILILVPTVLHADPGGAQFGFRYAQDVYPFLLLLMVRGMRGRVTFEAGLAIAVGLVVNIWGMGATYFDWFA